MAQASAIGRRIRPGTKPLAVHRDTDADFLDRLRQEPDKAVEDAKEKRPERQTLAKLVRMARDQGKDIHPIAQPGDDVFDLLDDEVIQGLYPSYPGRVEARKRWEQAMAGGKERSERKNFWEKEFKTPITVDSCTEIARQMRLEDRVPESLRNVLEGCERLAAELG